MSLNVTDIEKQNLEAHVELCAQRYRSLELRMDQLQELLDGLNETIQTANQHTIKVLIGASGTIIASIITAMVMVYTK